MKKVAATAVKQGVFFRRIYSMRYLIGMILLAVTAGLVLACVSLGTETEEAGIYYEGAAMGYRGMIHVRVGMNKGTITDISVIESFEDRAVGGAAIEELTDLVLMYNTTEIDAVSGATETSRGFLEAIENAIMNYE